LLLVSVYALHADRREVLVVWPVGAGSQAQTVAVLAERVSARQAAVLCAELTRLSQALWDTYARPASAAEDELERAQREEEREQFAYVVDALREPNQPDEYGLMVVSASPVEEAAHRLGRLLQFLADPVLIDAVVDEARTELDAVVRAELGDLSGRAIQAMTLDRLDVSPIQVAAADDMMQADPLDGGLLSAPIDPAAACVAAAHWLAAAAVVAAGAAGNTPAGVFVEADGIQAVSVPVPTGVVIEIEDDGRSPRQVVLDLLRVAVAAADGEVADLPGVLAERARLVEMVQRLPVEQREDILASEPVRTTLLDPRRPARDLLEHLLDGIASCQLLYAEYAAEAHELDTDESRPDAAGISATDDPVNIGDDPVGVADDPEAETERYEEIAAGFAELVRIRAAATRARLS
jgi:hypothetical protein